MVAIAHAIVTKIIVKVASYSFPKIETSEFRYILDVKSILFTLMFACNGRCYGSVTFQCGEYFTFKLFLLEKNRWRRPCLVVES